MIDIEIRRGVRVRYTLPRGDSILLAAAAVGTLVLMWLWHFDPFYLMDRSCSWILFAARNGIR
jgi:hypothetical protein